MTLKKTLMQQGMKLMSDPRFMKIVQSEQFMKAMMTAMSMPGKIDSFTKEQSDRLAKVLSLATAQEMKDLKRTIRSLEEEVASLKRNNARP